MIIKNLESLYAFVSSTGISLVYIIDTDELLAFTSFNPAEGLLKKHTVTGRDVSSYFAQNSMLLNYNNIEIQKQTILTKVTQLPLIRREYSSDIKWTTFLAL